MADKKISQLTGAATPLAGTEVLPVVQSGSTVKVSVANLTAGRSVSAGNITVTTAATTSQGSASITSTDPTLRMKVSGGTANKNTYEWRAIAAGAGFDYLQLRKINDATSVFTELFQFDNDGNQKINLGNLIVGTAAKGIDFSANSHAAGMTSELLNWYEEGTWTPVISDGTNDATMNASNAGAYTRIGNCVTFTAYVGVQTIGSVGADAHIKGLPFTAANANRIRAGVAVGYGSSLNITQGRVVTGYVELNSSKIELQYWDAATGTTGLDGTEISDGGTLFISGHYYVS